MIILCASPASTGLALASEEQTSSKEETKSSWIAFNHDYFGKCVGDCSVRLFAGRAVTSPMTQVFGVNLDKDWIPPWRWQTDHTEIIAGSIGRRLATLWGVLDVDPELGVGQRIGHQHATEIWGAVYLRWTDFPWNKFIITTIGLSTGVSFVTRVDAGEAELNEPNSVGIFQHYFSPEVTFALPRYPQLALMLRFHHRSRGFVFGHAATGDGFASAGLEYRF